MSYFTQYVPEQIMNMVSKIKEATIDVGPQPVKFAKFTSLPYDSLYKLMSEEILEQFKINMNE